MDILALLKKDHESALMLFDELDQIMERGTKKQGRQEHVFNQLRQELEMHMLGEEDVFYPLLSEDEDTRPMIQDALEEHRRVKLLLTDIGRIPRGERWNDRLKDLRKSVEQHIEEEEDDIFERAEDLLGSDQRGIMGNRVMEIKEEHMAASSR
ncbi:MAG: hemerythrin domain-containing protein [Nitrospirota bacterium]